MTGLTEHESLAREAKLISALADLGVVGAKAKAAARLLDGVEYDADHEPTNLDGALAKAKAAYGDALFTNASLTAGELEAAKAAGKTPEEYDALKGIRNLDDWNAMQDRKRAAAAGR
jgi:hypothetical protein